MKPKVPGCSLDPPKIGTGSLDYCKRMGERGGAIGGIDFNASSVLNPLKNWEDEWVATR